MSFSLQFTMRVLRALDPLIEGAASTLLAGNPETLERYREQVGFLRGLKIAREILVQQLAAEDRADVPRVP